MKQALIKFLNQILKDKNGNYSLREVVIILFVICTIISWIAQQFFKITAPEYMFYSFVSIIAAGCFGYSFESRTRPFNIKQEEDIKEEENKQNNLK